VTTEKTRQQHEKKERKKGPPNPPPLRPHDKPTTSNPTSLCRQRKRKRGERKILRSTPSVFRLLFFYRPIPVVQQSPSRMSKGGRASSFFSSTKRPEVETGRKKKGRHPRKERGALRSPVSTTYYIAVFSISLLEQEGKKFRPARPWNETRPAFSAGKSFDHRKKRAEAFALTISPALGLPAGAAGVRGKKRKKKNQPRRRRMSSRLWFTCQILGKSQKGKKKRKKGPETVLTRNPSAR